MLPDLITAGEKLPMELFDSLEGKAAFARVTERVSVGGLPTIALAEPVDGVTASNGAIAETGTSPAIGETVRIVPHDREGKVTSTNAAVSNGEGGFIEVSPRFTQTGDAGAPVIDANGKLVAMAYAGTNEVSYLVPLHDLLKQRSLTLAPSP